MKTLEFEVGCGTVLSLVSDGSKLTLSDLRFSGFVPGQSVTLIVTSDLATLLAREDYYAHVNASPCRCRFTKLGVPESSWECPIGQRLAAAITSTKEGTL